MKAAEPKRVAAGRKRRNDLRARVEELSRRLAEAEETLQAIRSGDVDAVVVASEGGDRLFTLSGAERAYRVFLETMGEGALTVREDGLILYVNRRFSEIVGMPMEKIIGKGIHSLIASGEKDQLADLLGLGVSGGGRAEIILRTEEAEVPVAVSAAPLPESDPPAFCLVASDLTERKKTEAELARHRNHLEELVRERTAELSRAVGKVTESETRFRLSVESMLDGFAILSPVRGEGGEIEDFLFLHVNEAGCRITEISREEHLGATLLALYPGAGPDSLFHECRRVAETGEPLSVDSRPYRGTFEGREMSRYFDIRAFRSGGNVAFVFRDVTERKEVEETVSRLASFPEVNPNPVVEVDLDGVVHYLNPTARRLFPALEEAGPSHPWLSGVGPILDRFRRGGKGSHPPRVVSVGDRHFQLSMHHLEDQGRVRIYSIDITERMQAEEELTKTKMLLEMLLTQAPVGFAYFDRDLRFLLINERLAEMNGLPAAAHLGKTVAEIVPSLLPTVQKIVDRILATGEPVIAHEFSGETPLQPGVRRYWSETWYPVCSPAGQVTGFGAVVEEITARKLAEDALKASLADKELLLRELAHRTKNNMQIIAGLLVLQATASKDGEVANALSDIQNRIRSMALVHEYLYKGKNFVSLNMKSYVQDLVASLLRAHRGSDQSVAADLDLDEFSVSIDTGLPCGLIITELVSNSMKHAFRKGESGSIFVSLRNRGGDIELRYRDDGPGLPPDLDLIRVKSLGLKLVRNLAERQLRGTMDVRRDPGTEFVFGFRDLDLLRRR